MKNQASYSDYERLKDAVCLDCTHFLTRVLREGTNPNVTNAQGYSLLYEAAKRNCLNAAACLCRYGADVDQKLPAANCSVYQIVKEHLMSSARYLKQNRCAQGAQREVALRQYQDNLKMFRLLQSYHQSFWARAVARVFPRLGLNPASRVRMKSRQREG